jgi:hypothetical protein
VAVWSSFLEEAGQWFSMLKAAEVSTLCVAKGCTLSDGTCQVLLSDRTPVAGV